MLRQHADPGGRLAIFVFDWLNGLKDALPKDLISDKQYPKVFAWIQRFNGAIKAAKAAAPKPTTLKGDEAAKRILAATYAEAEARMDEQDPINLGRGEDVEVWPTDSGSRHHDRGLLVCINEEEIVLQPHSKNGEQDIRIHFPRTNFRISPAKAGQSKL